MPEFDYAAEVAKLDVEYEAKLAEIEAEYQDGLKAMRDVMRVAEANPEWWLDEQTRIELRGGTFMTERDFVDRRDRRRREAQDDYLRGLQALALKRGVLIGDVEEEARLPDETLPAPPRDVNAYTFGQLEKAVRLVEKEQSLGDVARDTSIDPHDAPRVQLMFVAELLRLNDSRKLVVDGRVLRVHGRPVKYALRYLDDRRERWLDPVKTLRGPQGGKRA